MTSPRTTSEILPLFGRRTVVIDLRGHGRSSAPATGYDAATLSTDVGAVVDAVTEGPVHVVTFSRGTTYALDVGARQRRARSVRRYRRLRARGEGAGSRDVATPARRPVAWNSGARAARHGRREQDVSRGAGAVACGTPLPGSNFRCSLCAAANASSSATTQWSRYEQMFPHAQLVEFPDSPHDIFRPDRGRYPRLVRRARRPRGRRPLVGVFGLRTITLPATRAAVDG